jgi:hypothetical protein
MDRQGYTQTSSAGTSRDIARNERVESLLDSPVRNTATVAPVPVDVLSTVQGETEFGLHVCRTANCVYVGLHQVAVKQTDCLRVLANRKFLFN